MVPQKVNRQTHRQTETHMDISTYRKHRPRGPMLGKATIPGDIPAKVLKDTQNPSVFPWQILLPQVSKLDNVRKGIKRRSSHLWPKYHQLRPISNMPICDKHNWTQSNMETKRCWASNITWYRCCTESSPV